MGKIYDALAKAQKQNRPEVETGRGPSSDFYDAPGDQSPAGDWLTAPAHLTPNVDRNLVAYQNPQSIESEMFKILRGNVLFPAQGRAPKSILVTSALPGEGKSFVAANLAVSIAQNINENVLLIDGDIRRPAIHTIFGMDAVRGLAQYLQKEVTLPEVLVRTDLKKLTLLPAGKPPANPAELLSSREMRQLLEEVTHRYADRYVIIDSPPPQLAAETSTITRRVDGVILVVKSGATPRDMVADLVNQLGKEKVLGVVMNWFDLRSSSYYGYGKYGLNKKRYRRRY